MERVLLGYTHSRGVIKDNGVEFNNINLWIGDLDEGDLEKGGCVGIAPYQDPIKVKFDKFEEVTGVSFSLFQQDFPNLQYCPVDTFYTKNRYGRDTINSIVFHSRED